MDLWNEAFDKLSKIERRTSFEAMSVDQQLQATLIRALLSIGQELSAIHHHGINPDFRHVD